MTPLGHIAEAVSRGKKEVTVSGLPDGAAALLIAQLGDTLRRPVVVVTAQPKRAQSLANGIGFFAGQGNDGIARSLHLPVSDTMPYHPTVPNRYPIMSRVGGLFRLAHGMSVDFVTLSVASLIRATLPKPLMNDLADLVLAGDTLDREQLLENLDRAGYSRVPLVEDPGTYAVRGGILDVYSPVERGPVRIDLFDDMVDSLRLVNPSTQRSGKTVEELTIAPVQEVLLTEETLQRARGGLREQGGELGLPAPQLRAIMGELQSGMRPLGVEGWLPAFYEKPGWVQEYIPDNAVWIVENPGAVQEVFEDIHVSAAEGYAQAVAQGHLVYAVDQLFADELPKTDVHLSPLAVEEDIVDTVHVPLQVQTHHTLRGRLQQERGQEHALQSLNDAVCGWRAEGRTVLAVAAGRGHAERLRSILAQYGLNAVSLGSKSGLAALTAATTSTADVVLSQGDLAEGFVFPAMNWVVLGTQDILPVRTQRAQKKQGEKTLSAALASFRDLGVGDFVVHVDHGIGRYDGLVSLTVEEVTNDYLKLTYRDANRGNKGKETVLYLPVQRLDRVQKYVAGDGSAPSLDRLGTPAWEKTKSRIRKVVEDIARELLAVQAAREAQKGHAFGMGGEYYHQFETDFPYELTPDQGQAIEDVMDDMTLEQPMDRLVCGDVGYGKTEVAMRAAFRAVLDGKQVAVLVPTTVLCEQHRLTFSDRFRGYPARIAALSRFRSNAEKDDILAGLKSGAIDVVIGTHRLFQSAVEYRNLGLLVIDEEHRFGVKHKEAIKQLKQTVDVMTMTATPIPRTLNMALSGIRKMSIIATPPTDRLAVRTLVSRESETVVQEAIERELRRSGQVYFLHNRVGTIHREADKLRLLFPKARIGVGHGQMPEAELERVMLKFMAGELDVLVCTTIIESGLDIPRANTMLINRADTLGLAQLYQLRGRIGRSSERAYCYLLIPEPRNLTATAEKRVATIQRFSDLGSGFHIATMDMEMRGAGNLLGPQQSGHVREVGLELFSELLADAVHALKQEDRPVRRVSCETKLGIQAYLPAAYVPDVSLRLQFYKLLATATEHGELDDIFSDLVDQCGRPPEPAKNLLEATHLKIDCQRLGGASLTYNRGGLVLRLAESSALAGQSVVGLLQRPGSRWTLTPNIELVRPVSPAEWDNGLESARAAIRELLRYAEENGLLDRD